MPDRPLRIAMFSDSALPILNGVSISIRALIHEMRSKGHSVTLFTASHFGYRDPDPNTYRFPAVSTPMAKDYPVAIPPFYPMLKEFRKHTFDVVHTHTPFTIGFVGLRWAESHDLPIVSTYHTLYDRYSHYIPLPRRYVRFKIAKHTNFYYNNVDHVITPSEAAMKWLSRHSVSTPITVIPTGVPAPALHFHRSEARMALGIGPEERILLYAGRIAQEKNLGVLFEAAAIVFQEDPALRLWLVGDGPFRNEATDMVRSLGIGDRVNFVGYVKREDVDRYYAAADLFLFGSITETQGLVVQEAMSHGLPVIVASGGGASAAVVPGENGFVVKNEPTDFAAHILRVIENDDLFANLSEGARRSVRGNTTGDMAERVLDLYRGVIEARKMERQQGVLLSL